MMRALPLAAFGIALLAGAGLAHAQAQQPMSCSQTVGASAAAVPFPASGSGPSAPKTQLAICNAHASNTLGVNWTRGTASIGAAGTLSLNPGGCISWGQSSGGIPASVSVIGSAASTTTACGFN